MKDLISVIVPVYNIAPYLDECVGSLIAQTFENIEIILVDDGSTDGSGELCDKFKKLDKRVKCRARETKDWNARRVTVSVFATVTIGWSRVCIRRCTTIWLKRARI